MTRLGDHWLTVREAAEMVGPDMEPRRMRRRLIALHAQRPELGLLRRLGKRWFEVSAEALQRALTTDPGLTDAEVSQLAALQEQHEAQLKNHLLRIRALEKKVARHDEQLQLPGLSATA